MSDSDDSDYNVEEYLKPTVKRSTYDNDDTYLEKDEESDRASSGSEAEEVVDISDVKEQIKHESQCVVKTLKIQPSEEPGRTSNRLIIYVSNLTKETTRTMLEAFFSDAGQIKSVRIPKKRLSNFAFVEMKDIDGYKNALKYDGKELDGKKIKVQQGSKNKKHITNKSRIQKKQKFQIFEKKKLQNKINKNL